MLPRSVRRSRVAQAVALDVAGDLIEGQEGDRKRHSKQQDQKDGGQQRRSRLQQVVRPRIARSIRCARERSAAHRSGRQRPLSIDLLHRPGAQDELDDRLAHGCDQAMDRIGVHLPHFPLLRPDQLLHRHDHRVGDGETEDQRDHQVHQAGPAADGVPTPMHSDQTDVTGIQCPEVHCEVTPERKTSSAHQLTRSSLKVVLTRIRVRMG